MWIGFCLALTVVMLVEVEVCTLLGSMIFCGFWFILLLYVQDGQTALYIASKGGHDKIVELLLRRDTNVNHQTKVSFSCSVCVFYTR